MVVVTANLMQSVEFPDLTINGSANSLMKKKLVTWQINDVKKKIEQGVPVESVEIDLNLTASNQHVRFGLLTCLISWLQKKGEITVQNDQKRAGVTDTLLKMEILPPTDPFM